MFLSFPNGSASKKTKNKKTNSACNAGDPGDEVRPWIRSSSGGGNSDPLQHVSESLSHVRLLEPGSPAWRADSSQSQLQGTCPWTEEPGGLQGLGSRKSRTRLDTVTHNECFLFKPPARGRLSHAPQKTPTDFLLKEGTDRRGATLRAGLHPGPDHGL